MCASPAPALVGAGGNRLAGHLHVHVLAVRVEHLHVKVETDALLDAGLDRLGHLLAIGRQVELKAIADKPTNPTLGEIARQRLAQVLAAQSKADEALKLLDGDADKAFVATREELKGDLLVQLGRTDEANAAYKKAKAALSDEAAVGGLQIKLDDLAKGDA